MLVGMILAAGFGTRLQPLTENLPKALVEFCGKPMISHVIEKMKNFGIERIVVNVHHHREKLIDYLTKHNFGVDILISDEKDDHLLTGGGIKNAINLFGSAENIIVHNTDIISAIDYSTLLDFHRKKNSDFTLAIRKKNDDRVLLFDSQMNLIGWKNKISGEVKIRSNIEKSEEYGFTGVYVISKNAFDFFPSNKKFDIIDFLLRTENSISVKGFVDKGKYWFDLGSLQKISEAEKYFGCK